MKRWMFLPVLCALACSGDPAGPEVEAPPSGEASVAPPGQGAPGGAAPSSRDQPIPTPALSGAEAAAIAVKVRASPGDASTILAEHDLTVAAFEAILRDVALNPTEAKAYAAAMGG